MKYPLITIITPSYNQAEYIEKTIQSIINQDYPNLEYIIIDGGSTDGTIEIIKKYEKYLSCWISEKDNGQSDAINKGLKRSTGVIFNWINSDDYMEPDSLYKIAEAYNQNPDAAAWIGGCNIIKENGELLRTVYPNGLSYEHLGNNWNGRNFYQPACFLNAEYVKKVGGIRDSLHYCMDFELYLRLLKKYEFIAVEGIWANALRQAEAKTVKNLDDSYREVISVQNEYGFTEGAQNRYERRFNGGKLKYIKSEGNDAGDAFLAEQYNKVLVLCCLQNENDKDKISGFLSGILPSTIRKNPNIHYNLYFNFDINFQNNSVIEVCKPGIINSRLNEYRAVIVPASIDNEAAILIKKISEYGVPLIVERERIDSFQVTDGYNGFTYSSTSEAVEKLLALYEDAPTWGGIKNNLLSQNSNTKNNKSSKKKIIIIQGGFPSVSATFIMDQMAGLIKRGFEIENWSTYKIESETVHPVIKEFDLLSKTRYIKAPPASSYNNTDEWVKQFLSINNIEEPLDVAAFHVHYGPNFNLLEPLFKKYSQFVLVSFHGYDASRYFKENGDKCYNYLFERANLITTPSEYMKKELVNRGCRENKVRIHRYGIELELFKPGTEKKNDDKVVFLTVGRFVEKKGIEYSLKAFAAIYGSINAEYRIVGEGKLENIYRSIIAEYGLKDKIIFTGPKNKDEVVEEMKAADIFVLTSVTASDGDCEGVPVSLTEAHAAGLPVISTFHAGIPELVIDGETGFLSEERDVEETAKNMLLLAKDVKLRKQFALKARQRVENEFDINFLNDTLAGYLGMNAKNSNLYVLEEVLAKHSWAARLTLYKEHYEYSSELKPVKNPAVSVIILSVKMNPDVLVNIQTLEAQRKNNLEIIFLNNGADENEFNEIKPYINTYIKLNKNTGAYLARNIAAAFASAKILVFLDDDAKPAGDFIEMHLKLQNANKDIAAIRGKCLPVTEGALAAHYDLGELPIPYYSNLEGNLSVKAEAFFKIGGFSDDISFGYGGAEFSYRLKKISGVTEPAWYFPQPLIHHDYIKDEVHSKVKKQRQEESLKRIVSVYNDFESYLAYYRTLKSSLPEPEIIRAGDESLFNSNILKVNWVITRKCNYQCSYCKVYDNKNGFFVPLEKLKLAVDRIAKRGKDRYIITITGGEPTIHPAYTEFVKYAYDKLGSKADITTITNLSRTKHFYETFSKEIAPYRNRFKFQASYHFEFAKTETFINNASILAENNINVNISMLSHPERMDEVRELYNGLKNLNPEKIRCELILVRENYGTLPDKRYTSEDLEWLNGKYQVENSRPVIIERKYNSIGMNAKAYYTAAELNIKGFNQYKGLVCSAGDKMMSIDQNGNVSPAVCFRGPGMFSGNIYDGTGTIDKVKNIICPFDRCGCVADLQLPKFKNITNEDKKDASINTKNENILEQKLAAAGWQNKSQIYNPVIQSAEILKEPTNPVISVIVISWRLHPDTIRNFEALQKQRNTNFELIFVNNGGKDGEFDSLKAYTDIYIKLNKNTGAYLARNIGSLFASAPLLLFLEDDGIPADNFIKAHLSNHNKYDIIAMRGIYAPKTNNPFNNYAVHYYLGEKVKSIYVDVEGNASYRKDIFYKAGGWDDNISFGGGGPELAIRLLELEPDRRKQIYSPDAVLYHDYAVDEEHFNNKRNKQVNSRAYLRNKHKNWDVIIEDWNKYSNTENAIPVEKNKTIVENKISEYKIKLSVCIPTYNRATFLKEAIESVLVDTGNYEIVVVDDGSTDNTPEMIKEFNSEKIHYYRNEINLGRPGTRNRCIKEASGEYILWLDDDDLFLPGLLSEYSRILNNDHSIDVVYGNLQSFDNETGKDLICFSAIDYTESNKEILQNIIDGSGITNMGSAVRKSLYEKYGYYDPEYIRAQDNEFWTRVAPYAKFHKVNRTIARYRKHNNNVSIGSFIDTSYESKIIRKILNRYPLSIVFPDMDYKEAYFFTASGLYKLGDYFNSLKLIKLLDVNRDKKYLNFYFDCLINQGFYQQVLDYEHPNNPEMDSLIETARRKASALLKFKQVVEEAFRKTDYQTIGNLIQSVINQTSNNFDVLFSLGRLMIASGDVKMAEVYLKTALKYNPASDECFKALLTVSEDKDKINEVSKIRERMLEDIPFYEGKISDEQAMPLISVIITTYNRKDKLPAAVKSVLEQEYKNVELIVVNDAGEDISNIINSFNDSRIKLLNRSTNKGPSAARNTGINAALGTYIAFLDDDDIFYPSHLTTVLPYLRNHDVVYTDSVRSSIKTTNGVKKEVSRSVPYSIDYRRDKLLIANISPVNCFVFKKSLTDKAGLFNETLLALEDWEFWLRLSEITEFKHVKQNTVQVNWYDDGSTITTSKQDEFSKARDYIYKKYADQINSIPDKEQIVAEFNAIWRNDFSTEPVVSIIALTYNQLGYTKAFIESVLHSTAVPFELILVDNNSSDNTSAYLTELASQRNNIKVILNKENMGFPGGVNQGIKAASGKYILIANNDIIVTENWLNRMVEAAESNPSVGIVGPVSNSVSGVQVDKEAKYSTIVEMFDYARKISVNNKGKMFEFPRIAFLCTLVKKEVIDKIGGLDERFSPGNFEDDDFCLRAQIAGYKAVVLQDVFVHHFGSKSFTAEGNQNYIDRLEKNKQIFIDKWGADPEEIWLQGKRVKKRKINFPLNANLFAECFERAVIQIEEKEYNAAELMLREALAVIDQKGSYPVTRDDIEKLLANIEILKVHI